LYTILTGILLVATLVQLVIGYLLDKVLLLLLKRNVKKAENSENMTTVFYRLSTSVRILSLLILISIMIVMGSIYAVIVSLSYVISPVFIDLLLSITWTLSLMALIRRIIFLLIATVKWKREMTKDCHGNMASMTMVTNPTESEARPQK